MDKESEWDHIIVYEGILCSLAVVQRRYLPPLTRGVNDMTVLEGVLMRPPMSIEDEEEWFEGLRKRKSTDHLFAVLYHEHAEGETPKKYRFVGITGLHYITWPRGSASTGSFIFDKTVHGKGVGTEAKLLLLHHAFHTIGLRTIRSEVKAFNGNSWGHLLKCGYRVIGRVPAFHMHEGGFVDEILFYLKRARFEPIWKHYQESKELPRLTEQQKKMLEKKTGRQRPKKTE